MEKTNLLKQNILCFSCLLGIITKKDVLQHIAELHGQEGPLFD